MTSHHDHSAAPAPRTGIPRTPGRTPRSGAPTDAPQAAVPQPDALHPQPALLPAVRDGPQPVFLPAACGQLLEASSLAHRARHVASVRWESVLPWRGGGRRPRRRRRPVGERTGLERAVVLPGTLVAAEARACWPGARRGATILPMWLIRMR